jgi:hypothetical protein
MGRWEDVPLRVFLTALMVGSPCVCGEEIQQADRHLANTTPEASGQDHFQVIRTRYRLHMLSCPSRKALEAQMCAWREIECDRE